uniref:Fatty acid desaturase domain-containing protein n=1 Tax=Ditylenchus dipsaci TaxID=166011 RepID=A0A915DU81_9BILA
MWYNGLLDLSAWQLRHGLPASLLCAPSLELNGALKHFFRFWLWLTTAQNTREWTAVHRKHHAKCETPDDPHSPVHKGLSTVLRKGAELYREEARNPDTLRIYGKNCPDDWIERNLYSRYKLGGIALMAVIDLLLFGTLVSLSGRSR